MFTINGKVYRNLEEQVLRNQELSEENADKIAALEAGGGGGGGGSSPLVESSDFPGCYYINMPDDLPSWLNPPMIEGEEYRLLEQAANGLPIYVKTLSAPVAGSDIAYPPGFVISYNTSGTTVVRGHAVYIYESGMSYEIPNTSQDTASDITQAAFYGTYFVARGEETTAQDVIRITVWYTKD